MAQALLDAFQYDFMVRALIATLLISPLFGMIGTLVVDNRLAFFSDSLGHSALTGVALGAIIGLAPGWSMVVFGVGFALLLIYVKNRNAASTDTTIGVFSSTAIALGVVLLSKGGSFAKYSNILIGDLLSVTPTDLWALLAVLVVTLVVWAIFYNSFYVLSLNPALAISRGMKVRAMEMLYASLIALVVMVSIRWVGILIINALLVLPAAASRNVARSARSYHVLSVLLALGCGVLGLMLSYVMDTASGASIVLLLALAYFVTLLMRKER